MAVETADYLTLYLVDKSIGQMDGCVNAKESVILGTCSVPRKILGRDRCVEQMFVDAS